MELIQHQQEAAQRNEGRGIGRNKKKSQKSGGKQIKASSSKSKKKKDKKKKSCIGKLGNTHNVKETAIANSGSGATHCKKKDDKNPRYSKKKKKNSNKNSRKGRGTEATVQVCEVETNGYSLTNGKGQKIKLPTTTTVAAPIATDDVVSYEVLDKHLEEMEKLEAAMSEERELIQNERKIMAFERESLELQLNEEIQKCEELMVRVNELEQLVQSHKLSNAGNDAESTNERESLKLRFEHKINELERQLFQKESEIQNLRRNSEVSQEIDDKVNSDICIDGNNKSREWLRGELLQTAAKLAEKEIQLKRQEEALGAAHQELASLHEKGGTPKIKIDLLTLQEDNKAIERELSKERKENTNKLKEKDETIAFLMNELVNLKQRESMPPAAMLTN